MTRPDHDGRYGGQGGVLGAQPAQPTRPEVPAEPATGAHAAAQYAQGQQPQGQHAQGQHAQGQYAQGQYAQGQYAQGQHAPGQYLPGQHTAGPQIAGRASVPQAAGPPPQVPQPAGPQQQVPPPAMPQQATPQGMPQPAMPPPALSRPAPQGYPYQAQPGVPAQAPAEAAGPGGLVAGVNTVGAPGSAAYQQAAAQQAAQQAAYQHAAYQHAAAQAAAQQAIAAQAAAAQATALATAAAEMPEHGTVYSGRGPHDADEQGRVPSGRLTRLRIGWHSVSPGALAQMGVSSPGIGLILGADLDQKPVPVRFFRPEPTRIALVGGVWAAQLIAFRALALGANAVVMTGDPAAWHGFGERSTGRGDRVTVIHGEQPVRTLGTAQQPVLVIHDLGVVGPSAAMDLGPWQTQLTVLRQLDERGVPAVQEGQLVMMQRLGLSEAALAASALRLTGQSAQLLQVMEDEMLALIGGGADRYVWISPTSLERHYAGAARR